MDLRPLRLRPGEDLRRALEAAGRDGGAFVVAGIGSLDGAVLRLAGRDDSAVLAGAFEIVSLAGSLSADGAHLHMSVADADGRVRGGHVAYGNRVRTTAEILLAPLPGWALTRAPDAQTGFAELVIHPTPELRMPTAASTPSDIHPALTYDDAPAAIEWLCRAFGFRRRFVAPGPDGRVEHAELSLGTGVVMVASPKPADGRVSPKGLPGVAQVLSVFVADPDAHHAAAVAAGAQVIRPLQTEDYGARGYMAKDPEGHVWYFGNYRPGAYWED